MRNAPARPTWPLPVVLMMLCALMLTGCATTSLPMPPAAPTIPLPPVVGELPPSGVYWTEHCKLIAEVRSELKLTRPMPEPCATVPH